APHRLRGRSRGDAPTVGEHDVPRAERGELEGDRRAHGAGARYDDSSHSSSSRFSLSLKRRNGARTSSRTGTPRRPSTYFAAAWNGKRSSSRRRDRKSTRLNSSHYQPSRM